MSSDPIGEKQASAILYKEFILLPVMSEVLPDNFSFLLVELKVHQEGYHKGLHTN